MYVNDGIGYKMQVEQPLFYSDNCFGHADTLSFRQALLRIHDYKSGGTPASMKQLEIYAALFCLEYIISPHEIDFELRVYQNDDVAVSQPETEPIERIMEKIIRFDQMINEMKGGW